ncbi:hypothetical protein ACTA71_008091 [Dictyostelium dimigraforme]
MNRNNNYKNKNKNNNYIVVNNNKNDDQNNIGNDILFFKVWRNIVIRRKISICLKQSFCELCLEILKTYNEYYSEAITIYVPPYMYILFKILWIVPFPINEEPLNIYNKKYTKSTKKDNLMQLKSFNNKKQKSEIDDNDTNYEYECIPFGNINEKCKNHFNCDDLLKSCIGNPEIYGNFHMCNYDDGKCYFIETPKNIWKLGLSIFDAFLKIIVVMLLIIVHLNHVLIEMCDVFDTYNNIFAVCGVKPKCHFNIQDHHQLSSSMSNSSSSVGNQLFFTIFIILIIVLF